jgi:hypothetical protein
MMRRMEALSLRFAAAARTLGHEARRRGVEAPAFRSPPRVAGADRTVRRSRGTSTVSIAVRGRPWPAVLADMVEGVVVANGVDGPEAHQLRTQLWEALAADPRTESSAGVAASAA